MYSSRKWVRKPLIRGSAVLLFVFGYAFFSPPPLWGAITNDVCEQCHTDISEMFHNTAHGTFLSDNPKYADNSCEACHGDGTAHVESGGEPGDIINPARSDQFGGQLLCLSCHSNHSFDEWSFSAHSTAGVGCSDCHQVHVQYEQRMKKSTPELCYDCHSNVRAAAYMPSHHPIEEGKIECQDCHSIHGGSNRYAMSPDSRELCFTCHPKHEGPFVYEHAPVNEDCMICHVPHGSVANNLLRQNEPILCLSCHASHFHAGVVSVDGDWVGPMTDPSRRASSHEDAWKEGMLTKCTTCHTEVHGSDLPSQAISTGGNALTR